MNEHYTDADSARPVTAPASAAAPAHKPRKRATNKPSPGSAGVCASKSGATPAPLGAPDDPPAAPAVVELIRMPLSVRWRDLDAFNHVNNSQYFSFLEEARLCWMMGLPGQGLEDDVAPVVAAAHLNYRRPIAWPAALVVELFVERLGNTSVSLGHRITDAADPAALYCDGHVVMVWIGRQTGRAAALPPAVRRSCSAR